MYVEVLRESVQKCKMNEWLELQTERRVISEYSLMLMVELNLNGVHTGVE